VLALDVFHVHARLFEKRATLDLGCLKQKLLGALPIVGRGKRNAKHVQYIVVREGLVDEWRIEKHAVRYDNRPTCVLVAGLPGPNLK
jgi:hypothetical protein